MKYNINDIDKTACEVIRLLDTGNRIVAFEGAMGAGKTTLIKEICRQLGSSSDVSSPTFAIVNQYELGSESIYHFDFYRINKPQEALDLGLFEYLDSGNWCFIEWHEKIIDYLPNDLKIVRINDIGDNERELTISQCEI